MTHPNDAVSDDHLSQIATLWTAIFEAHQGSAPSVQAAAQQRLLERYQGAVYRYLLAATRDPHATDDLFQEFALRFVRGDFRRADPGRGRFRDFLKTALYHLVVDHQRRGQKRGVALGDEVPEPAVMDPPGALADEEFLMVWKAELMSRAWAALLEVERTSGEPLHTILRHRIDHPEDRSADMARLFGPKLGRDLSANWVRKRLHTARKHFTEFLIREVERSLGETTQELVEQELIELGLWEYCRSAMAGNKDPGEGP